MAHGFGETGNSGLPYLPGEVAKRGLDRPFMLMRRPWSPSARNR